MVFGSGVGSVWLMSCVITTFNFSRSKTIFFFQHKFFTLRFVTLKVDIVINNTLI
jgi:hypothetical protein